MAFNDFENNKQYTKYTRHVDDSKERVKAESINKIQEDVASQQHESNKIKDKAFEERVYTIFNNNLYTNAMFKDILVNGEYINLTDSSNVEFNPELQVLTLKNNALIGEMKSSLITSVHGPEIELNDFFIISNEYIPLGASIKYYIETIAGERYPITQNALKLPMHLVKSLEGGFRVIIVLSANGLEEKPYVSGYAVLYHDAQVEADYGLTNPDLQRFP